MVDFSNRDEVEGWLRGRPREDFVVLAARAALRVLPVLGLGRGRPKSRDRDVFVSLLLPCFRATVVSWVAAKFPTRGAEIAAAASRAVASDVVVAASRAAVADSRAAAAVAVAADAAALESGEGASAPAGSPLWPAAMPEDIDELWGTLKGTLLSMDATGPSGRTGTKPGSKGDRLTRRWKSRACCCRRRFGIRGRRR